MILGLRFCKLLFPNSQASCLPGRFCQWEVLSGDYKEGEGPLFVSFHQQPYPTPMTPASSFFQPSQHHHTRSPQRHQQPPAAPSLVVRAEAVRSASTRGQRTSQHWTFPLSSRVPVTSLLSLCSFSPQHGSCFLKLLISALGGQEAVTNIWVTSSSPFQPPNTMYPILSIESALLEILRMSFCFPVAFYTIVNKIL